MFPSAHLRELDQVSCDCADDRRWASVEVEQWDRLWADCRQLGEAGVEWSEAVQAVRRATGVEWCDAGIPGEFPPVPPFRDLKECLRQLPRQLRRLYKRTTDAGADEAIEVIGLVHDAMVEAKVTGVNRLAEYLEHFELTVCSVREVELIKVLRTWVCGSTAPMADLIVLLLLSLALSSATNDIVDGTGSQFSGTRPSPGRLADASARLTNAPPLQFVAPFSAGELVMAA